MTPGTKIRTKVTVTEPHRTIGSGAVGTVLATHPGRPLPVEVAFRGKSAPAYFRSDELETIE